MNYKLKNDDNVVLFSEIENTETFLYGGNLFMKLPPCRDIGQYNPRSDCLGGINAISLSTEALWFIPSDTSVEKIDGMFVEGAE